MAQRRTGSSASITPKSRPPAPEIGQPTAFKSSSSPLVLILRRRRGRFTSSAAPVSLPAPIEGGRMRSEEHTSELQSLMRISYAVFCLKKKNIYSTTYITDHQKT